MTKPRLLLLASLVLVVAGCASPSSTDAIEVTVVSAANTSLYLPGIDVTFIAADGSLHQVGQTDPSGMIRVPKDALRRTGATVVLFCHPHFFCGALRVKDDDLFSYDEYLVALSPVTVR
jgi:hypothetical protein